MWLTGLSGAGKTTIAQAVVKRLRSQGRVVVSLDGDDLREGLSRDLGFEPEDRAEQARRTAHVALLVAKSGGIAVVALISPFASDRRRAAELHARAGVAFHEVWIDTPVEVCAARDPKGLYAAAQAEEGPLLPGVGHVYERPSRPALRLSGLGGDPTPEADAIVDLLDRERAGGPFAGSGGSGRVPTMKRPMSE